MSTESTTGKKRGRKPLAAKIQADISAAVFAVQYARATAETWAAATKDDETKCAFACAIEDCDGATKALASLASVLADYAPTEAKDFGYDVGEMVNVRRAHRETFLLAVDDPSELTGCIVHKIEGAKVVLRTESGSRLIVRRSQILPSDVAEDENTGEAPTSNETTGEADETPKASDVAAQ